MSIEEGTNARMDARFYSQRGLLAKIAIAAFAVSAVVAVVITLGYEGAPIDRVATTTIPSASAGATLRKAVDSQTTNEGPSVRTQPPLPSKPPQRGHRTGLAPLIAAQGTKREGCYIVKLRRGAGGTACAAIEQASSGSQLRVYRNVFEGFAKCGVTAAALQTIRESASTAYVQEDSEVTVASVSWSLDRLDQSSLPLSGTFDTGSTNDGSGVDAYVLDTGIRASHTEFGSRVQAGISFVSGDASNDCHGHGTHVAASIGGYTFGVAKAAHLVPVQVLDCNGLGSDSSILAGLEWSLKRMKTTSRPAVINLSFGAATSYALDDAVREVVARGAVVTVAAGNDNTDACNRSPGRVLDAITVGSSTSTDDLSTFSNTGACVNVIAPGSDIVSAGITSNTATSILSGTSMAAAAVAGAAALYRNANPTHTPAQVRAAIESTSVTNAITGVPTGTANRLLHVPSLVSVVSPPAVTVPSCSGDLCESGILAYSDDFHYHPVASGYFYADAAGPHHAIIHAHGDAVNDNADFDLVLLKWNEASQEWDRWCDSLTKGNGEDVWSHGSAGYYSWEATSYSGAGGYTLEMSGAGLAA